MSNLVHSARVLVDGLDHPDGVAYDHASGVLYAGGEEGQVYQVDIEDGLVEELARTPGFTLGLAVDGRGRVVICDAGDGAVWCWNGAELIRVLDVAGDRRLMMPNVPAFGPDGSLYVTDSGGWNLDAGAVVAFTPDGTSSVLDSTLKRFPNGCTVTPDGIAFTDDGGVVISCYRPDRIYHMDADGRLEVIAEDRHCTLLAAPPTCASSVSPAR